MDEVIIVALPIGIVMLIVVISTNILLRIRAKKHGFRNQTIRFQRDVLRGQFDSDDKYIQAVRWIGISSFLWFPILCLVVIFVVNPGHCAAILE